MTRCSALTVALGGVMGALPPAWAAERWVPSATQAVTVQRDNDAERWASDRVLAGARVDFDERCGSVDTQTARDDVSWRDPCRTIAAESVVEMLTAEPWRSSLPDRGLQVRGASLTGELHLGGAHVASDVQLERCRFEGQAYLDRARLDGMLSLDKSTFEQGLFAPVMRVGGDLYLRDAKVRGQVELLRASVGGDLVMDGATIDGGFSAASVRVGGGLYLRDAKVHGPLMLRAASVGGNLELNEATFGGEVEANSLRVDGALLLREARFATVPEITLAHIALTLDVSGAALPGLDLSGTAIAEDLRLGSALPEHTSPRWQGNAQLVLRNVHAGAVQDRENAWPPILDLQGFTYDRLGGVAGAGHDMLSRPAEWYVGWLARDAAFTRQPYQQLAAVFRAAGDPNRANAVLYAERNRELAESWQRQAYLDVLGLAVLHSTIGYGLGRRIFRVLYWIAGFTALGIAILRFSPSARAKGLWWCLGASLDRLLPIVELNKEFGDFFDDPERRRLKGWQAAYFSVQALVGYLLGTFVVAALSGLTQAS